MKKSKMVLNSLVLMIFTGLSLVWLSCDDRTPTKSSGTDDIPVYTLALQSMHIALDQSNNIILVGEDVVGTGSLTRITAQLTDEEGAGLVGRSIEFSAKANGVSTGSFAYVGSDVADESGFVQADFTDTGAAMDNPGTQPYEGVTLTARFTQVGIPSNPDTTIELINTLQFDVIDTAVSQVWPYRMVLIQDTDVIYVDGGSTKSTFSVTLMNNAYEPLEGLLVNVSATPDTIGILSSGYVITDAEGKATFEFTDSGDPDVTGTVSIAANFDHPVYGSVSNTKQVSVIEQQDQTVVLLSLTAQPVVGPDNNFVIVGEDVNDNADSASLKVRSRITATVTDADGVPVSGKLIEFFAIFGSDTSTTNFDLDYLTSDAQGLAWVNFYDEGESAIDNIGTPTYEGVTVVGYIDDVIAETRFNVYDQVSDVWPYRLNLYKDRDFINLDNGLTKAEITAVLSNQLNKPLKNVEITFSTDLGFINDVALTDTTGTAIEYFTDLGDPADVGISTITANYQHPSFGLVTDLLQISIIDPSTSGIPAYIVIPASHPGDIMVTGGGGLESTNICAQVYDENGLLVDVPTMVQFDLGPSSPQGLLFGNGSTTDSAMTMDGIACVSLNSGTKPGPVYITASIGGSISATSIPVIVVTGPAFNLHPQVAGTSIIPIDGGLYQIETSALVYDLHGNPVADSTYVYWSIDVAPSDADDTLSAEIIGVSFTNNESIDGNSYPGIAYSYLIYTSDGIFDWGRIYAYTYGDSGVVVGSIVEDDVIMPYYGDNLLLTSTMVYWDFTTMGNPAMAQLTATLTDHYGVPVEGGRIQFLAPAATMLMGNPQVTDSNGQAFMVLQYDQGVCAPIPNPDPQLYEDFTSSCVAFLLDPMQINSDPLDILLVRTYQLAAAQPESSENSVK